MMRRILAGAAIAGFMLGFSATSASADVPNPYNKGKQILSQLSLVDDLTLLNDVGNDSVKYIDVLTAGHLQDIDLSLLSNQESVGDDN
ncbi:hypothetical protein E1267_21320 [Nonomuraea longispora]|uniref:Uncharacterized protein n=1 Tax=Nonomuraea longispora TaxID=1848320 RepID=A0A4R4N9P5_9ACTN|nr:hypothetical protein [Nonomuraea longispora]TDC04864.1 hypothetical protein E1267_21320 [Nonomuraea longispora]